MYTSPEDVVWHKFGPQASKNVRVPTFSLVEQGRLVTIIKDPVNTEITTDLMKKWDRADLDAKAGAKGIDHVWNQFARQGVQRRDIRSTRMLCLRDPCQPPRWRVQVRDEFGTVFRTGLFLKQ